MADIEDAGRLGERGGGHRRIEAAKRLSPRTQAHEGIVLLDPHVHAFPASRWRARVLCEPCDTHAMHTATCRGLGRGRMGAREECRVPVAAAVGRRVGADLLGEGLRFQRSSLHELQRPPHTAGVSASVTAAADRGCAHMRGAPARRPRTPRRGRGSPHLHGRDFAGELHLCALAARRLGSPAIGGNGPVRLRVSALLPL